MTNEQLSILLSIYCSQLKTILHNIEAMLEAGDLERNEEYWIKDTDKKAVFGASVALTGIKGNIETRETGPFVALNDLADFIDEMEMAIIHLGEAE